MKKLIIIIGWFVSASLAVGVSISTTYFLRQSQKITFTPNQDVNPTINQVYAQVLGSETNDAGGIQSADARPILLANFLETHKSPLKPYDYWGGYLTQLADLYQLDYRLIPSIAMQESNLCKVIPEGSFNCLGLGVHSKGTWGFTSYEENFDAAARVMKRDYIDKGYVTPEEIQTKYTPSSNGSWQFAVNHFMDKIASGDL
jgi:hypothetical protein